MNANRIKTTFGSLLAAALTASGAVLAADSPALTLARQLNEAFIEVADKVSPSVVVITVTEKPSTNSDDGASWWDLLPPEERPRNRRHRHGQPQKAIGEGSGVVITEDGYILTNDHVVENAEKIKVRFKDGRTFEGEIKGIDPQSDIAVIKINAKGLAAARLGDSDRTRVGEFVLAIGAPFALSDTVTFGHVSAKGRTFKGGFADQDFIQTDASINPGNSGGPLVNLYGEVIAINTMIEGMNTGIGFAVPINLARHVKDHLIADGKFNRSWIGVIIKSLKDYPEYQELDKSLAPDTDSGVVIEGIAASSPASKSELRPGDVIVSVEGKPVATDRELRDVISQQPAGKVVTLNVVRGKEHLAIKVRTESAPSNVALVETKSQPDTTSEGPEFGLTVQELTKDLAEQTGVEPDSGVIVTAVERDSPGEEVDIQPGDVITAINRQPVTNPKQYRQLLKTANPKKGTIVSIINNGSTRIAILRDSGQ